MRSSSLSSCCHCLEVGWQSGLVTCTNKKKMACLWGRSAAPLLFYQVLLPNLWSSTKPELATQICRFPRPLPPWYASGPKLSPWLVPSPFAPRASSLSDTFRPRDPSLTDAVTFASTAFLWGRRGILPQSAMLIWGPTSGQSVDRQGGPAASSPAFGCWTCLRGQEHFDYWAGNLFLIVQIARL